MKKLSKQILESFDINESNEISLGKSKVIGKLKTISPVDDTLKLDKSKITNKEMYNNRWNPLDFTYSVKDIENYITDISRKGGFNTTFDLFFDKKNEVIVLKSKQKFDHNKFEKVLSKFVKSDDNKDKAHLVWIVDGWMNSEDSEIVLTNEPIPLKLF